jgi:hypothetical protein
MAIVAIFRRLFTPEAEALPKDDRMAEHLCSLQNYYLSGLPHFWG